MKKNKRILIAAGGTGGHVMPGLALAAQLRDAGYEVIWLGTEVGIEKKLVTAAQFQFHSMQFSAIRRKGWRAWALLPFRMLQALAQTVWVLHRIQPQVVVGMGGYVAAPCGVAAWLTRRPLILHEQNAVPGLTNRCLSYFAKKILTAFPEAFIGKERVYCVGNPVRADLCGLPGPEVRARQSGPLRILILGGSQGAQTLNTIVPQAIADFAVADRPKIWHQTGKHDPEAVRLQYAANNVDAQITPFIEDMAQAYQWADLVIARAGAMTIAEICTVGLASILVPYPHAVDDHQTANARYLSDSGAAILLPEGDLSAPLLFRHLVSLHQQRSVLLEMAKKAHQRAHRQSTEAVVAHCLEYFHV